MYGNLSWGWLGFCKPDGPSNNRVVWREVEEGTIHTVDELRSNNLVIMNNCWTGWSLVFLFSCSRHLTLTTPCSCLLTTAVIGCSLRCGFTAQTSSVTSWSPTTWRPTWWENWSVSPHCDSCQRFTHCTRYHSAAERRTLFVRLRCSDHKRTDLITRRKRKMSPHLTRTRSSDDDSLWFYLFSSAPAVECVLCCFVHQFCSGMLLFLNFHVSVFVNSCWCHTSGRHCRSTMEPECLCWLLMGCLIRWNLGPDINGS